MRENAATRVEMMAAGMHGGKKRARNSIHLRVGGSFGVRLEEALHHYALLLSNGAPNLPPTRRAGYQVSTLFFAVYP